MKLVGRILDVNQPVDVAREVSNGSDFRCRHQIDARRRFHHCLALLLERPITIDDDIVILSAEEIQGLRYRIKIHGLDTARSVG